MEGRDYYLKKTPESEETEKVITDRKRKKKLKRHKIVTMRVSL